MTQLELWGDYESPEPARKKTELQLFVNEDDDSIAEHRIARCVYAESLASSLPAVEALCVMIKNTKRPIAEIANDESVFESLCKESTRHEKLLVDYDDKGFQMCLRAVRNMRNGILADKIFGATRFHRADISPEWANSIGTIAEIDGLMFYI